VITRDTSRTGDRFKLRILHISDIHFRCANGSSSRADMIRREMPRRARVIAGKAWKDNLAELLVDGVIDLVCLTGDVADWGKAEEFEQGTRFLDELLATLQLPRSRLLVVPGNHDIDRGSDGSASMQAWTGIRRQPSTIRNAVSDWMAGGTTPAGVDDAWRELVLERQVAYRAWVERGLCRAELLAASSPHGRLGYRIDVGPTLGMPVPVWIIGLDTSWLAGDDNDSGKLLSTKDQLLLLSTGHDGYPLPGLRLALGHHPLAELADGGDARALLADYADLYLHGHQHQPIAALSVDPDRHLLELAAGCLFEGTLKDEHPNGFQVINLTLDEQGRPRCAELRFRSWSARGGYWHDDSSIYREARQGRLTLTWPAEREQPSLPQPRASSAKLVLGKVAPSRLPSRASRLFGRDRELAQLDQAWADDAIRVLTIVAAGGVGKTSLVSEWRNRLLAREQSAWEFDWSFYSQGTRDRGAVSADRFMHEALMFFGDSQLAESNASAWQKGARLAELVGGRRSLLILDGLEPLQEPPGVNGKVGALREPGIAALLKGLAHRNCGLCLVTTRAGVLELVEHERTVAPRLDLDRLSARDGAAFLGTLLGAVVSTEAEREEISEAVGGHALTLQLLGSYIRRARRDVRAWREIDINRASDEDGGHAFRVMDAYVRWLGGAGVEGDRELALLRLMGLFDRPADAQCIEALRAPPIPGLTDALSGLDRDGWQLLISTLEDAQLLVRSDYQPVQVVGYDEETARATEGWVPQEKPKPNLVPNLGSDAVVLLDAHPLVRTYFGNALRKENEVAWREGHWRLFEYLRGSVPYWPEGLEGLQPLYQAIVHGCAAGRAKVTLDVYQKRILRDPRAYSLHQLGAFSTDLAVLMNFFEGTWDQPSSDLIAPDRAWLLNQAAYCLHAVGRLIEALSPRRASLKMAVALEGWTNAAVAASNLSRLELLLGHLTAVEHAAQAMEHADRSGDEVRRIFARTALAESRLTAGDFAQARELFEEAESMEARRSPDLPQLISLSGYQFCELLLSPAERIAWRGVVGATCEAELITTCAEVFGRATRALAVAVQSHRILDIALAHVTLGRSALYTILLRSPLSPNPPALTVEHAREHLEAAIKFLRQSGNHSEIPKGLTTRAWLRHHDGRPDLAHADLDEAWSIAERGPMPLHQADIQLYRARLFHDREALATARTLIIEHGYGRRLLELEDAENTSINSPR
jgi:tetratricopeptide (TPR) repeat protein